MISVSGLTQSYGNKEILNNISLSIEKNEVCALVGRNGAGKSTFINSLLGLIPIKKGEILVNGKTRKSNKRWKNEIAYLPEKFMLYPSLTGYENIVFFAQAGTGKADPKKIEQILNSVGLWEDRSRAIKGYSKGMLQRLGLAITLYQDSDILILDEPTSGIDPMGRKEILEVLRSLSGKTILLSSHHLDEIKQICTHVAFLENGKMTKYTVDDFLTIQELGGMEK
ncbi:ABC transporter ATP-binding protein [Mesobacillus boroniphilus]|uniref:ABC transporter ATP-binding protein n=1 Tax=Mesobacillus boroniphilus TaxID=308892 RepID=A0A944GYG1_9BACI|nr:ABC transporter ATP-binding protein [Mesobacillus boroniphilus]MBS8265476.1 ABC transporter ATP-binding protein [Mesobacillus boroniphilus]